jgi:hypothetical protein
MPFSSDDTTDLKGKSTTLSATDRARAVTPRRGRGRGEVLRGSYLQVNVRCSGVHDRPGRVVAFSRPKIRPWGRGPASEPPGGLPGAVRRGSVEREEPAGAGNRRCGRESRRLFGSSTWRLAPRRTRPGRALQNGTASCRMAWRSAVAYPSSNSARSESPRADVVAERGPGHASAPGMPSSAAAGRSASSISSAVGA